VLWGLFSLFRPDQPLHLLKGEEAGIDISMFPDAVKRHFGVEPRTITPGDMRLLPDPESDSGFRLYCKVDAATPTSILADNGELVEPVVQVGLELRQHELAAMSPTMLREISLCCFNDMRTVLLVHDKRMLGIIKQELPSLVARKVLTATQAAALDAGIVDSALPGSPELAALLEASRASSTVKDGYILKPIRGGKGVGILFGDEMAQAEWLARLEGLRVAELRPGTTYVVQRRIVQRLYDLVLRPSDGRRHYPLVGTYHVINGKLLGLGTWRASSARIVAISGGGSGICSVVRGQEVRRTSAL
jgi:hypothetical protein